MALEEREARPDLLDRQEPGESQEVSEMTGHLATVGPQEHRAWPAPEVIKEIEVKRVAQGRMDLQVRRGDQANVDRQDHPDHQDSQACQEFRVWKEALDPMDQRENEEKGEKPVFLEQLDNLEDPDRWVRWVSEAEREIKDLAGKRVIRVGQGFRVYQVEEDSRVKTDSLDHLDLLGTTAQGVNQVSPDLLALRVTMVFQDG